MNKQEFDERTGFVTPQENYEFIEKTYMFSGNLTKDEFCKDYKKHADSIIIEELTKKAISMEKKSKEKSKRLLEAQQNNIDQKYEFATFLIQEDQFSNNDGLRKKAISLVGERYYLKTKIELGYQLTKDDAELVYKIVAI